VFSYFYLVWQLLSELLFSPRLAFECEKLLNAAGSLAFSWGVGSPPGRGTSGVSRVELWGGWAGETGQATAARGSGLDRAAGSTQESPGFSRWPPDHGHRTA